MVSNARRLALCFALAACASMPLASRADTAAPQYGSNLIVNGDAEQELGAPDNSTIVKPTGWTTTGQFTAVRYGASGGFPDATSIGPPNRGKSLFEGGNAALSTARQTIALASYAKDIDAGSVSGTLHGWLGGYSSQDDNAMVTVAFLSETGARLGAFTIGPVLAAERNSKTGLIEKSASFAVPKLSRSALVTITITRKEGEYNDGSVDDLSLVLKSAA